MQMPVIRSTFINELSENALREYICEIVIELNGFIYGMYEVFRDSRFILIMYNALCYIQQSNSVSIINLFTYHVPDECLRLN